MIKTSEELGEELCEYCEYTGFGTEPVNTGPYNLCEGMGCVAAYEYYCDDQDEEPK